MLTALDETLHHQVPLTFDRVQTTDHRFYDRQLMGGFRPDGMAGFLAGITVFKNMNVIEGFVMVQSHGKIQHNVRFSKQFRPNFATQAQVGGLRLEIIEAFKELRYVLERGDYPIEVDITFTAVLPPRLEKPHNGTMDGRQHTDYLRYNQMGQLSGHLMIDGERFDADNWFGWRDHSWGVRPGVGGFEPMTGTATAGGVASAARTGGKGLFLIHAGFWNGTQGGGIQIIEDGEGKRIYTEGDCHTLGKGESDVREIRHKVVLQPNSRVFDTCDLEVDLMNGETWTLNAKAVGGPWCYRGGGYDGGFNDGLGQGVYRSQELLTEVDAYDISDGDNVIFPDGTRGKTKHREQLTICEINGVVGSAYMPMFIIGNVPQLGINS